MHISSHASHVSLKADWSSVVFLSELPNGNLSSSSGACRRGGVRVELQFTQTHTFACCERQQGVTHTHAYIVHFTSVRLSILLRCCCYLGMCSWRTFLERINKEKSHMWNTMSIFLLWYLARGLRCLPCVKFNAADLWMKLFIWLFGGQFNQTSCSVIGS